MIAFLAFFDVLPIRVKKAPILPNQELGSFALHLTATWKQLGRGSFLNSLAVLRNIDTFVPISLHRRDPFGDFFCYIYN